TSPSSPGRPHTSPRASQSPSSVPATPSALRTRTAQHSTPVPAAPRYAGDERARVQSTDALRGEGYRDAAARAHIHVHGRHSCARLGGCIALWGTGGGGAREARDISVTITRNTTRRNVWAQAIPCVDASKVPSMASALHSRMQTRQWP